VVKTVKETEITILIKNVPGSKIDLKEEIKMTE
jgi:hypothetical protein